jgi:Dolichyl-phosphate-mannose-protein mannosyltransferase
VRQRRTLGAATGRPPSGPDDAPIAADSGSNVPLGYLEPETVPIPVVKVPVMAQPASDGVAPAGLLLEPETIPIPVVTDPVDAGGYRANGGDSARAREWLGSVLPRAMELPGLAGELRGSLVRRRAMFSRWPGLYLTDELVLAVLAIILSIGFFAWYDAHGLTFAFNDARSREMIARRVVMSRSPGLAQLGSTWLPLPFMLMLPLMWDETLFSSGIAGSLPSMLGYVLAVIYMYRIARLVSSSRVAGWLAAGVLMLNPSLLYMQSTAMSESASLSAYVVATYYALRVAQTYHALDIVKCATAAAAGTLVRYENWVLAIIFLPILVYICWRRRGRALAEAWVILYSLLAFAGCAAWVIYNIVIFHDPLLSFFYGHRSHNFDTNVNYTLPARHHAFFSLQTYGLTVADTVGWAILGMSFLGLIVFVWRARLKYHLLPTYLTLVPFGFYWLVLYLGINTEGLPQLGTGPYYNIRFGLLGIPAVALFSALLTTSGPERIRFQRVRISRLSVRVSLAAILVCSLVGPALQTPFVLREALSGYGGDTRLTGLAEANWFHAHYHGGNILYTYVNDSSMMFYLLTKYHFSDRAFITDAENFHPPLFRAALANPERWVSWIVMYDDKNTEDLVWYTLHKHTGWRRYFVLRKSFVAYTVPGAGFGRVQLFERRAGLPRNLRAGHLRAVLGAASAHRAVWGSMSMPVRDRSDSRRLHLQSAGCAPSKRFCWKTAGISLESG